MLELHNHRKLLACLGVGKELKKTAALEKLREAHRNSSGPRSLTTSKNVGFACLPDASPAAGSRDAHRPTPTLAPLLRTRLTMMLAGAGVASSHAP